MPVSIIFENLEAGANIDDIMNWRSFYGFNRPGAKVSQGIIQNWWRQGMMGSALAQYEEIRGIL